MQYRINRCALQALLQRWQRDLPPGDIQDVAQRLSQWLGAMDAVRLDAAMRTLESAPAERAALSARDGDLLDVRWEQGVQELRTLVAQHGAPEPAPRGRAARPRSGARRRAGSTAGERRPRRSPPARASSSR